MDSDIKTIWIPLVMMAVYVVSLLIMGYDIAMTLSSVLLMLAIVVYKKGVTLSLFIMTVAYLLEAIAISKGENVIGAIMQSAVVPFIGILIAPFFKFKIVKGKTFKETIINTLSQNDSPRKSSIIVKTILVSLSVSLAISISSYMETTLVVSFWLIIPFICQVLAVMRSHLYYFAVIAQQLVTLRILYMQYKLGEFNLLNTSVVVLTLAITAMGLMGYLKDKNCSVANNKDITEQ